MGDVFHFTSPQEPTTLAKHRPRIRPRTKLKKKHLSTDMFTHRAYAVARCDEPVFCPTVPEPLMHTAELAMPYDMDHELDDEDDEEAGGVALPPLNFDITMTDDFATAHTAQTTVHTTRDTPNDTCDHEPEMPGASTARSASNTLNIPRPDHPRPETREIWEEEDGRRLRLALEGDGPDQEPLFALPTMTHAMPVRSTHQPQQALSSRSGSHTALSTLPASSTATSRFASRRASHDALTSQPIPGTGTPEANPPDTMVLQSQHLEMEFDDDALAVDDPLRSYDVSSFMDLWRLRSLQDRRLPAFNPGLQPSLRLGRPKGPISKKHVSAGSMDMQGIRWGMIGPSRADAAAARAVLHPSPNPLSDAVPVSSRSRRRAARVRPGEKHFQFRSFIPQHQAKFSHYQLRNVLAASDRNDIFYVNGHSVMRTSLACPDLQQTAMDLTKPYNSAAGVRITCLAASPRHGPATSRSDNVLLAGGFLGEYAIRNMDGFDEATTEGYVSHAMNGLVTHVHTYANRRSNLLQAAFCSNDQRVRLMDVGTLKFTSEVSYGSAINCAATSPDGRLRVLVGDSHDTFITDADSGQTLITLKEHRDLGFACDWSRDGRYVATGAQDGTVLVWDARNWSTPLRSTKTVMSCARSLHFTDDGALVVAEHDDIVSVYDSKTFDAAQEIRFFGSIAGVAILDGGAELAIANADKTVGGLLTFERTAQGLGGGTFGKELARGEGRSRRRQQTSDLLSGILV